MINKKDIVPVEDVKTMKISGKAIECKACKYVVEDRNLNSAMLKMAFHKKMFKHLGGVKTYTIYE